MANLLLLFRAARNANAD